MHSRILMLILAVACILMLAGCDAPDAVAGRRVETAGGSYRLLTPAELRAMLAVDDPLLVNVHIPYEGELEGTDLFIPYNAISDHLAELPDKDARIIVYCKSGPMSEAAARELVRLGYTRVFDLEGGFTAWQAQGYELLQKQ